MLRISDEEIAAAERAVPIVRLLEQVVTYHRPGSYRFAQDFPQEYATWTEIASTFQQSGVRVVRHFGRGMADVARGMREADEAVIGGDRRQVRRKVAALNRASKALTKSWEKFAARLIAEELAKNGV